MVDTLWIIHPSQTQESNTQHSHKTSCLTFTGLFVSNLCVQAVNNLVQWIIRPNGTQGAEMVSFMAWKHCFSPLPLNNALPSFALLEAFLQSGEHLNVIWASLYCYHDKNTVLGPKGSIKKGLNWDCDWHRSRRWQEGCNHSWLCVDSGAIHRSLKKSGTASEL